MEKTGITRKFVMQTDSGELDIYLVKNEKYIDVRISKLGSEMTVYNVLVNVCNRAIECGCNIETIAETLAYHRFPPSGWVNSEGLQPFVAASIPDLIGRFLKGDLVKLEE